MSARTQQRVQRSRKVKKERTFVAPTGATAGTPGTINPGTSTIPRNIDHIKALGALGQGATWTTGQYVRLANGSEAYWNGTTWAAGRKP